MADLKKDFAAAPWEIEDFTDYTGAEGFNSQKFTDNPHGGPVRAPDRKDPTDPNKIIKGKLQPRSFIKASDAYANHKEMVVKFVHVPSGREVSFKAFITQFSETYNSDWSAESVFGRIDPIYLFKSTTRDISVGFKVPAASESEAFENLGRIQELLQFLYPNYTELPDPATGEPDIFAQTISQSPMIRLKVMNLLQAESSNTLVSPPAAGDRTAKSYIKDRISASGVRGLLGVIQNVSVNHNLEGQDGVFEEGIGVVLPKLIDVSLTFRPIHEGPVGWGKRDGTNKPYNSLFPYGINLDGSKYPDSSAEEAHKAAWLEWSAQEAELDDAGNLEDTSANTVQDKKPLQEMREGFQSALEQGQAQGAKLLQGLGTTAGKIRTGAVNAATRGQGTGLGNFNLDPVKRNK